jgi:DNA-binding NarL/FixJ family response regulator
VLALMRSAAAVLTIEAVANVLIVDDNASFRAVARTLLESGGYRVVGEAGSAVAAVAVASATRPDVVLLDIGLPDRDGFTVCRELHAALPGTVIVFCSVRGAEEYRDAVDRSSAAGFLAKSRLSAAALAGIVAGQEDWR